MERLYFIWYGWIEEGPSYSLEYGVLNNEFLEGGHSDPLGKLKYLGRTRVKIAPNMADPINLNVNLR